MAGCSSSTSAVRHFTFITARRGDHGGVWVALRVSPDRSGAAIVDELVAQIEAIRAVAAGESA